MQDRLEPAGEPPVDIVGDVLGPVGADLVIERHLGGHDEMVGPEVHGAQVEQCVNSLAAQAPQIQRCLRRPPVCENRAAGDCSGSIRAADAWRQA